MGASIFLIIPIVLIVCAVWRPDICLQIIGVLGMGLGPLAERARLNEPVPNFGSIPNEQSLLVSLIGLPGWMIVILGVLLIGFGRALYHLRRIAEAQSARAITPPGT